MTDLQISTRISEIVFFSISHIRSTAGRDGLHLRHCEGTEECGWKMFPLLCVFFADHSFFLAIRQRSFQCQVH